LPFHASRRGPGKLSYGHAGEGSIQHLTGIKRLVGTLGIFRCHTAAPGQRSRTSWLDRLIWYCGRNRASARILSEERVLAVTSATRLSATQELPTAGALDLPWHDRDGLHWIARTGRDFEGYHSTDCKVDVHGAEPDAAHSESWGFAVGFTRPVTGPNLSCHDGLHENSGFSISWRCDVCTICAPGMLSERPRSEFPLTPNRAFGRNLCS
jgi:hypothetical protein